MDLLASIRVKMLLTANLLALAFLLSTSGPASAGDGPWETFCPPSAAGCDCLVDVDWNPDGCYDNNGDEFRCSSNEFCTQ